MSRKLRDEILTALDEGQTVTIWSRTSKALPICLELEREGICEQEFVQLDEQSSEVRFRAREDS